MYIYMYIYVYTCTHQCDPVTQYLCALHILYVNSVIICARHVIN